MFGLSYLSRENKLLLAKAQDRLTKAQDPKVRNETELLIQEILSEAKPYMKCDLMEAQELRDQLWGQIRTLEGLGKNQSAESFRMHVQEVDFHIQTLQMQRQLQEEKRPAKPEQGPNLRDNRLPTLGQVEREKAKQKQKAIGRARWTVDMEEIKD